MKQNGILVVTLLILLAGCAGPSSPAPQAPAAEATSAPVPEQPTLSPEAALVITSTVFGTGEGIPAHYSCDAENLSPPLSWRNVPEGTQSLALIMDDPDAPGGTFVHWVVYNISPTAWGFGEGVAKVATLEEGSLQGINDLGEIGYFGPCPPPGPSHRYFFRLYILDKVLDLDPGASASELRAVMEGHILAQAELMGVYPPGP